MEGTRPGLDRRVTAAAALGLLLAMGIAPAAGAQAFRVLVFSRTEGHRHDSIAAGIAAIDALGAANGFAVDATEDPAAFTDAGLRPYRVVVFLNTTGDVLDPPQEQALSCFIASGAGWVGVHSAADTEHGSSWYGDLLGGDAWFVNHPAIQQARLFRESSTHVSTAHYPPDFLFLDEWYNFANNPRPSVDVLLRIDETSYDPGPGAMGDHPIAWSHAVGAGRAWYTNMGHRIETFADLAFRQHLLGGIEWAAGCATLPCTPPFFKDGFESGSTCRWAVFVVPRAAAAPPARAARADG